MNQNNGTIGVIALYLLFIWLISAAGGAWLTEQKGYGERLGLLFGLVLSAVGLILALVLPGPARLEVEAGRTRPSPTAGHGTLTGCRSSNGPERSNIDPDEPGGNESG